MTTIQSIDPRQGVAVEDVTEATSTEAVTAIADLAAGAAPELARLGRGFRAKLLRAISDGLESARETIVKIADRETAIGPARLNGELTRTAYQARLFADVLDEGSYLEATIDHAGDTPMGPGPDLRRLLVPIGPVAVFGSSNFPLAFSVPGGDTVSAIAAGCPVIVKAHTSHPATSRLAFEVLADAAKAVGAPEGTFGIVFGQPSGSALVADPRIKAVGFTGSLGGGRALLDIIDKRREPIPFYGELASLNPVVITDAAAAARGADIADGLVTSVTVSAGQLCTKPGLVFIPEGPAGDGLTDTIVKKFSDEGARVLLNERIFESYEATTPDVQGISKLEQQAFGLDDTAASGFSVRPRLFITTTGDLRPGDAEECFGPTTIVVRYGQLDDLEQTLAALPSSLTFTLHSEPDETDLATALSEKMTANAGRILFNAYPTGVLVSWAQTHGGPWPATNSLHTSVGTTAIRRFLRPVTWQSAPEHALPVELRDADPGIPRRIDGVLTVPNR